MINEKEFNKIVAQNLRNLIYERDKNQATVAKELGINKATLSSWMNGTRPHVMQKVYRHALADKIDPMALKAVSAFQQTFQVE